MAAYTNESGAEGRTSGSNGRLDLSLLPGSWGSRCALGLELLRIRESGRSWCLLCRWDGVHITLYQRHKDFDLKSSLK